MKRSSKPDYYSSKPDYFQIKPVRGSSPTASLAADLSQNFHIDMRYAFRCASPDSANDHSPQLPTPRRSLFTSNLFGTIDGRGKMADGYFVELELTFSRLCHNSSDTIILPRTIGRKDGHLAPAT